MAPQSIQYTTLDVFTTERYRGNQLGVVSVPKSLNLSQSDKLKIAQEFNYSESIFVHEPEPNSLSSTSPSPSSEVTVDIFTTESELPFAGHPTIGAIHHILTTLLPDRDTITLNLKAGKVQGRIDRINNMASAIVPQEYHEHTTKIPWSQILNAQPRLTQQQSQQQEPTPKPSPLVSIVRGMNFVLVDLTSTPTLLDLITPSTIDPATPSTALDTNWPRTLIGTVYFVRHRPNPDPNDTKSGMMRIEQRVVVMGLEDPATGSASLALSCWLALSESEAESEAWAESNKNESGGKRTTAYQVDIVQGRKMGRKSEIRCKITLDGTGRKVEQAVLAGPSVNVMRGELVLD